MANSSTYSELDRLQENVCKAIDIIVQRAISQAKYDKTIQATIVKCVDQTIGKYTVRYQDSTFYAYSNNIDTSYSEGTAVYILVPSGDMSKDKTIVGAVKNLGIDLITISDESEKYNIIGDNNIENNNNIFGLKSYSSERIVEILYSKNPEHENKITVNETALSQYLEKADNILCGATFKTELPLEQQFNGNYGIIFALDFKDETGAEVTREYVIDINKMKGNPYRLINDTEQTAVFNIDSANYLGVNYIAIFCYDFPHSKPDPQEDIWIKDIELKVAERMTDEELSGYSMSFIAPKGLYFDSNYQEDDIITLQAQVKVKGKVVDPDSQSIDFYWFIENTNVTNQSEKYYIYYNQYGGQGWQCLNQYNLISAEDEESRATVQWVPSSDTWTIAKKEVAARENLFKCVAVYNGTLISKEVTIKRLNSEWNVSIESSQGTSFYFGNGKTNLTCLINGKNTSEGYTFCWAKINQNDYFETLSDTNKLNADYIQTLTEYNNLKKDIEEEKVLVSEKQEELNQLENKLKEFDKTTRIDKNIIYNVTGSNIERVSEYKCSVYQGEVFLGTGSIVLTNQTSAEGAWNLIIHNGEKIFKYNEYGISPADPSNLKPVATEPLTFSLYDNLGNKIDEKTIKNENIKWTVPVTNTMIKIILDEEVSYVENDDGTRTYSNMSSFPYKIADSYNVRNQRNNIRLEVTYQDIQVTATTNLIFIKEGDAGTNGSDYICKIIPNCLNTFSEIPMATRDSTSGNVEWNFEPVDENTLFKVQLWHNEDLIFNESESGTSTEGKTTKVKWSILKNQYSYSNADDSSFTIDPDTGKIEYTDFNEANPANILKVEVQHDDVTYYDTLPLITAIVNSGYKVKLKEDTGFSYVEYSSDGKQPSYDTSFPFELIVTEDINGYTEDISLKKNPPYEVIYEWTNLGSIKEGYPPQEIEQHNLFTKDYFSEDLNKNQEIFKAVDSYNGECVNNAVQCKITQNKTQIAKIHIPIHFMLDRYGNSAINGWDGNSVNINEEGGFILAPQAGAGKKEDDNSFTGILMGKVKEGLNAEENGLFGYYKGQRSIFMDAETGTATFGLNKTGQIIIDPTKGTAKLYSGNYSEDSGMLIDLTTPEIRYGNGNFSVDKEGRIIAKGDGSEIGGCKIEHGILQVPAAHITGQLIADQIAAGAITVGGLSEALQELINNSTAKVEVQYALGDSPVEPPETGWSPVAPPWEPNKYMWQKTVTTSNEGEVTTSDPTCITGAQGRGIDTTNVMYQRHTSGTDIPLGEWSATIPSVSPGEYLWVRTTYIYTDSSMDTFYTVSMMGQTGLQGLQGPKGDQGIQGPKGTDGKTSYFHVKYSDVEHPTSPSQIKEEPSEYIGTYVDYIETDSEDPGRYTWARFQGLQGKDGTQGIPGKNGENGQTSYLHIKYSNDGKTFTGHEGEDVGDYIGQYVDFVEADDTNPSRYTWSKIKGETGPQGLQGLQGPQGLQGIQGPKGDSGQTTYFHIKYSPVEKPNASQMTETPSEYIGTYTDFNINDSNDPNSYTWARFQGLQGKDGTQGIPGKNGENGQTSYLHIKYSNNGTSFTGNGGEDVGDYIGQYVDFDLNDSTDPKRYTWSKIKGETGPQGQQGLQGLQGVGVKSVSPQYYLSSSKTQTTGGNWVDTPPTWKSGYYYWTRSKVVYDDAKSTVVYTEPVLDNAINDANQLAHATDATIAQWCYGNGRTYIDGSKLYAGTVTAVQIAANTITSSEIKSGAITTDELAAGAVTSGKIASHTITANEITTSNISGTNGWINLSLGTFDYGPNKLKFDGSTLTVNGNITATSLTLAPGVTIGSDRVSGLSTVAKSGNYSDLNGKPSIPTVPDMSFYIRKDGTIGSEPTSNDVTGFKVSSQGLLTASNAVIYGKIYAKDGSFTGTVNASTLQARDKIVLYNSSQSNNFSIEYDSYGVLNFKVGSNNTSWQNTQTNFYGNLSIGNNLQVDNIIFEGSTALSNKYAIKSHTHTPSSIGAATTSHTHSYLPLTGGKVTGNISLEYASVIFTGKDDSWYDADQGRWRSNSAINFYGGASIYSIGGQKLYIYASAEGKFGLFFGVTDERLWALCPYTNIALRLGTANHKWNVIFADTGTINTSDRNQKNNIISMPEVYEQLFNKLRPVTYKFNNGNRTHTGFISQEVEEAINQVGLTAMDWAAFCKDPDNNGDFTYGLRYEEIIALNTHMIQKLMQRVNELEEQLQNKNYLY